MPANENRPAGSDKSVQEYDDLEHDLELGIGLAEARVQRLMGEVFVHPHLATNAFRKLSKRRGVDHAIEVLERDTLKRDLTFGAFRTGLLGWRRRTVAAALQELPEALRDLKHLNDRRVDVQRARVNVRPQQLPEESLITRPHRRGRTR